MKILFNTYPIAFDTPGGGEIQLLKTKAALGRIGHDVMLFDPWVPQLREADVVHYFSVYGGSSVFCDFVKAKKKPLAISSVLYPHKQIDQYPMAEIRHLLRICDIVLPNSRAEAELLADVCDVPIEKFHPVYNGVDEIFLSDPDFDGALFCEHFNVHDPFLLSVGNIEQRKNQVALARALASTDYMLVLLGHIRDQTYFEEMIKVSNGRIRYLGHVPNDSPLLRSAYLACDAFLLPSLLETPGLAALEAAAMGAKVVVTSVGSTREYFGDLVQYIDPEDESTFVPAIDSAVEEKQTTHLKSHVRAQFTWRNAAMQTSSAYQKLLTQDAF